MMEKVEVENLIVGAGVIGLAIGAAFARRGREAFVLEAGPRIGCGISSRNSEVVHSGIYYPTNSLKHLFCIEGRKLLYDYCKTRGIAFRRCEKLVVAADGPEAEKIGAIAKQAFLNGVENVEFIDGPSTRRLEPSLNAVAALHVLETGIVDSCALMDSLASDICDSGGAVLLRHRVIGIRRMNSDGLELDVESPAGRLVVVTRTLTLAAGLWTHALAANVEGLVPRDAPRLFLAKGSYFSYSGPPVFSRLIYPAPVDGGLGVHLTLDLHGRMRFGPDVEWLDSQDPDHIDFGVDAVKAKEFYGSIRRYWPDLPDGTLTPDYSGVRPKLAGPGGPAADFCLHGPRQHGVSGIVVLYGIESPGLTSSLAIGAEVERVLAA